MTLKDSRDLELLTVGVEEEFMLVDPVSRFTVPRAPEVHAFAAERLGEQVARELYATQVEINSRPAKQAEVLRQDLVEARRALASAAAHFDCMLVASGTAVLTTKPFPITEGERYEEIAERYSAATTDIDSEASGCHVHVGDLECDEALALAGHLRPWLPVLQVLAVNSPFAAGSFRRVASWRHYQQQAWPITGPTPMMTALEYEARAQELVDAGVLIDKRMIYWYARPSEHQPTLEIRVADVCADVDITLLVAVLTRALAMVLLADVRADTPAPRTEELEVREHHRGAATLGPAGLWTHPLSGVSMPLSAGVEALVAHARPALEMLDETRLVAQLLRRAYHRGTGAQRQRAAYRRRGRLEDVVDELAAQTIRA
ncbi:glutamate--cysteine ligase GCS2 [Catenulispora acidiphila DSM 44928]|uniref:Putative glutamate--cysteine ligase 2 n=1 Tax=Catenulispora acidiphila (strain DSM 44928 / JCM 14897 / NBRC 102108 / NRRL B-24433 / ID139908) TaxID=479433 RepID=C7PYG9_CATAD|nr:YbdK family carboxylate-amine ligase [Catenulispora acidiphila]ACU75459.1 glutamate--cysteine ligase GCS2 [Catenulispora acidiphila DSM 44928]